MKKIFTLLIILFSVITNAFSQDENGRFYSAGEIQSKLEVQYGRFEFMMYSSDMSGTTSTFFMWKNGGESATSRWNELDIETFGKSANEWQSNPIWEYYATDTKKKLWEGKHTTIPIANKWVKFALEWTPNYIAWFNNGVEVRRILKGENVPPTHDRYDDFNGDSKDPVGYIADPMRMCFNHWATFPGDWLGNFNPADLPSFQFVDWFTYQKWNGAGFDAVSVRHDYNSLAEVTTNYTISGHTFNENQCTFKAANVGVVNGMLWLSISGYNNARPPAGNEIPAASNNATVAVTGVSLSSTTLSLVKPATSQLTATIAPANATNQAVTWTTSNAAVATVSATGLVTSVNAGTATITVKTTDGAKVANCVVTVTNAPVVYTHTVPGTIQAEQFKTNVGLTAETTTDAGGGQNLGYTDVGDYADYTINVTTAGNYAVDFRVASLAGGAGLSLSVDGVKVINDLAIAATGGWQVWTTLRGTIALTQGAHTLRFDVVRAGFNLNWIQLSPATVAVTGVSLSSTTLSLLKPATSQLTATIAPTNATNKAVTWTTSNAAVATVSASGLVSSINAGTATITATTQDGAKVASCAVTVTTAPAFSQKIEAENYSVMYGVVTQATTDAGGGLNVGYLAANDWMAYNNITIPTTGNYTISYRIASLAGGGSLQLETNAGATILDAAFAIPNTGGWQNWQTITRTVRLTAGTYNLGLKVVVGGFNINWFTIASSNVAARTLNSPSALSSDSRMLLSPNPAKNSVVINKLDAGVSIMRMTDLSGKVCIKKQLVQGRNLVDIAGLKNGLYIVQYQSNGKQYTQKLVKID